MGLLSMLRVGDRGPVARRHRRTFAPSLGLNVEHLESRVVLSHAAVADVAPPALVGDAVTAAASNNLVNITDIKFKGLKYDAATQTVTAKGGTVTGLVNGIQFSTDITNFSLKLVPGNVTAQQATCAILNLELAPIHINLLGLHVDTSAICLNVTAIQGGGLLGDLLCGIAASGNTKLLSSSPVTGGLSSLLSGAVSQAPQAQQTPGADSIRTGECPILDLSLGPVDLNLLGLRVQLDDCEGGPVLVSISASRGEGLLGELLCAILGPPVG